ncbi:MAG TPA: hypothetical protein GX497_03485 [Bacillus bacterium]|nr:hypothetical protein [Bacillus sp. (in: firmicutes)]
MAKCIKCGREQYEMTDYLNDDSVCIPCSYFVVLSDEDYYGTHPNSNEDDISAIVSVTLSLNKIRRIIEWHGFVEVEGFDKSIDKNILENLIKTLYQHLLTKE